MAHIDALMASVREDADKVDKNESRSSRSVDKDESRASLSVIESAESTDNGYGSINRSSNDRDDDLDSCSIEIPNDAPVYDAGSEAEVTAQVMAEAGFA